MKVFVILEEQYIEYNKVYHLVEVCDSEETAKVVVAALRNSNPGIEYALVSQNLTCLWDVESHVGTLHHNLLKEDAEELLTKAREDNPDLGEVWLRPSYKKRMDNLLDYYDSIRDFM